MPQQIRLWQIGVNDQLSECEQAALGLESRLENWLARDISILSDELLVIGRQVETAYGGFIDLLCIDRNGDLVILELKRARTPREITAQTLDYASWINDLSRDSIVAIATRYFGNPNGLDEAFTQRFGEELPDSLNEGHRMLIVASMVDRSSERIIRYLSNNYGVNINAATFHYFKTPEGKELLGRVFLIDPEEVESKTRTKGSSKRLPNLSYEELEALANQNGVEVLYQRLVSGLEEHLQKHTTRSSISFTGILDQSRKTIISLLPSESSPDRLSFKLYLARFKALFRLSEEEAVSLLPAQRKAWQYYGNASDDLSGYQGYFGSQTEVDHFLQGLVSDQTGGNLSLG